MARIWVDILTPKQARFFQPLISRLEARGDRVWVTTRRYSQATEMINFLGIKAEVYGAHGGGELAEKLRTDTERIVELLNPVAKFAPDLAISFVSPTATRIMFGLGLPMINISDSPHAKAVSKLTIPLSSHLLSPVMIAKKTWVQYGITEDQITQYKAFDQVAWLKSFSPDASVLTQLGLTMADPIITIRVEEAFAAYLRDRADPQRSMVIPVVTALISRFPDAQIVVLPRYQVQVDHLKKCLPSEVRIPESVIDATSLISYSTLFIGAGGTMTIEAVLLGVPAISFFVGKLDVESWLTKKGMLYHADSSSEVIDQANNILAKSDQVREDAQKAATKLMASFEDPITAIISVIDRTLAKNMA